MTVCTPPSKNRRNTVSRGQSAIRCSNADTTNRREVRICLAKRCAPEAKAVVRARQRWNPGLRDLILVMGMQCFGHRQREHCVLQVFLCSAASDGTEYNGCLASEHDGCVAEARGRQDLRGPQSMKGPRRTPSLHTNPGTSAATASKSLSKSRRPVPRTPTHRLPLLFLVFIQLLGQQLIAQSRIPSFILCCSGGVEKRRDAKRLPLLGTVNPAAHVARTVSPLLVCIWPSGDMFGNICTMHTL